MLDTHALVWFLADDPKLSAAAKGASRPAEFGLDRTFGRRAFGNDPASYHAVRPQYPDWVFATLVQWCGLGDGKSVFEIGPGTGIATRRLLDLGAGPLIAIEPDPNLAAYLRSNNRDEALKVMISSFEDAALDESSFDLGVCATAFHWLEEDSALAKVAHLLRPGGWFAMVWNVFGDSTRPDPFHEATKCLLDAPRGPSAGTRGIPFALDATARVEALGEHAPLMSSSIAAAPGYWNSITSKRWPCTRRFQRSMLAKIARQFSPN